MAATPLIALWHVCFHYELHGRACKFDFHYVRLTVGSGNPLTVMLAVILAVMFGSSDPVRSEGKSGAMEHRSLSLVASAAGALPPMPTYPEKLDDHARLLQAYLDTHVTQNHSMRTIEGERRFLTGWFKAYLVQDDAAPEGERQLLLWEAMAPVSGRTRVQEFAKGLLLAGLKARTVHGYLSCLRRLFAYTLSWPYIPGPAPVPIALKYGRIDQPVFEVDYPAHSVERDSVDFVLTGDQLYAFFEFVRAEYLPDRHKPASAQRDYTMIVLAGESGLRADELLHLDAIGPSRDIFYADHCLQTRFGKATNGSGKRPRKTILTPFAAATLQIYEEQVRPRFARYQVNPALFLSETGARIDYRCMWRQLHTVAAAARQRGIDLPSTFSWHSLRKSFATNFMERYPDKLWVLMDLMGHLNPSTLHRYVKHSRSYYQRIVNEMVTELIPVATVDALPLGSESRTALTSLAASTPALPAPEPPPTANISDEHEEYEEREE